MTKYLLPPGIIEFFLTCLDMLKKIIVICTATKARGIIGFEFFGDRLQKFLWLCLESGIGKDLLR